MNTSVAAPWLEIVFANPRPWLFGVVFKPRGGHGGPPLQYVLWPWIDL